MVPRIRSVLVALLGLGSLAATGALSCTKSGAPPSRRPSLLEAPSAAATFKSPATWRYHPSKEASLGARLDLPKGAILLAGDRGERWLADKKAGRVSAAARLAPERIVFVMKREDRFVFVGQGGTSYESETPLGPFVRSSAPLDRLATMSAAAGVIVGVTRGQKLVRSEDGGATWQDVGPDKTRFVDVEIGEAKHGLALAVPEAWFISSDAGATWKPSTLRPIGAAALQRHGPNDIYVDTALGPRRYSPKSGVESVPSIPGRQRFQLTKPPPRGPSATALLSGRALLLGSSYLEVVAKSNSKGSGWELQRGAFDGPLKGEPLEVAKGCRSLRLAGLGQHLAMVCSRRNVGAAQELELYLSEDAGKSWERDDEVLIGKLVELSFVVAAGGQIVVSGICPPSARARGCSPYGVYYRRRAELDAGASKRLKRAVKVVRDDARGEDGGAGDEPGYEMALSATPALEKVAQSLAVSPDGRHIYAIGKRTKGTGFGIYVSRDGGRSFEGQEVPELVADSAGVDDDEEPMHFARPPRSGSGARVEDFSVGDDGSLSIIFRSGSQRTLAIADDEGRLVQLSRAPTEARLIGASGTRALAVDPGSQRVWESLDGGSSWQPVGRLPLDVCPGDSSCEMPLACTALGCTLGEELSRIGWRGQGDDDLGVLAPSGGRDQRFLERRVRQTISCTLGEGDWVDLQGVAEPPNANQASIGKVLWFALAREDASASARVVSVARGGKGRVDSTALLAPVARAAGYALYTSTQVEGVAALRYKAPESTGKASLAGVEVAWENFLEPRSGRGAIGDAGPYIPGDYSRASAAAQRANVDLLSVAQGGIFVRPHARGRSQKTYFLEGRRVGEVNDVTWPTSSFSSRVAEVVRIGGSNVFVRMSDDGAVVQVARPGGESAAFTTGLPKAGAFGMTQAKDLAYVGGKAALHLMTYDPQGEAHVAYLFPFAASGPAVEAPIAVPMLSDSADPPRSCGAVIRKDTPRLVVPYQPGTRHPVVVNDATEPLRVLLTARAVMHAASNGQTQGACVAALDAEGIALEGTDGTGAQERALVILDDSEPSWLFRRDSSGARYQARTMSCRFDPNAEVPLEVYSQSGTLVSRGR